MSIQGWCQLLSLVAPVLFAGAMTELSVVQFLVRGESGEAGKQQELAGVDWVFNAWGGELGGLYKPWDKDEKVGKGHLMVSLPIRKWWKMDNHP